VETYTGAKGSAVSFKHDAYGNTVEELYSGDLSVVGDERTVRVT
jgi:hypothetical protein